MSSKNSQLQSDLFQQSALAQESPLAQINFTQDKATASKLKIQELAFCGLVNLRGSLDNPDFVVAIQEVLNISLQMDNNRLLETPSFTILWLAPNEWMIITEPGKEAQLVAALRASLADTFAAVTDVSGGNTILEISGSCARDLLSCGSMLDFHQSQFSQRHCVQTLFAKTNVVIYQLGQADVFRMVVRRSFSDYLGTWLADAASSLISVE